MAQDFGFGFTFTLQDKFSSVADTLKKKWNEVTTGFKKEAPSVVGAMDSISVALAGVGAAAGLLAPFGVAIQKSAEFGAELSKLGAISGATTQELNLLEKQAKELGSTTKFSATQAAQGMNFLAMAGFSTNQIMSAMPDVLNLATAGQLSLAKASDISSNIMSAFGIEAENMSRVTDVLAKTATTANVNIGQIGQSMKIIAPQARALGVSIEEVSAFIGLLGDNGIQGTMATSSVRTAINRLANPTKKMSALMQKLAIDFFDGNGKFIGLAGTVDLLQKKMVGMTDKQKLSTIATIFGSEASTQFTALLGAQKKIMVDGTKTTFTAGEALAQYTKMLQNSGGAAKEMADKMSNNLQGSFVALQSQIETLQINIGQALTPIIRPLVEAAGKLVSFFSKIVETKVGKILMQIAGGITLVIASMIAWQAVTLAITPIIATFGATVAAAFWPVTAAVAAIVLIGVVLAKLDNMMSSTNEKTRLLGVTFAILLGPIGMIWVAVKSVTQGIKDFQKVAEGGEVGKGMVFLFQKVGGVIMGVRDIMKSVSDEGFTLSKKTNDALKDIGILDTVVAIGTWIVRIRAFSIALFQSMKTEFQPFVELWDGLVAVFDSLLDVGGELFAALGIDIGKMTGGLDGFKTAGKLAGKAIMLAFTPIIGIISVIAKGIKLIKTGLVSIGAISASPTVQGEEVPVSATPTPENTTDSITETVKQITTNKVTNNKSTTNQNNSTPTPAPNFINQITLEMDGEKIAELVEEKQGDKAAMQ